MILTCRSVGVLAGTLLALYCAGARGLDDREPKDTSATAYVRAGLSIQDAPSADGIRRQLDEIEGVLTIWMGTEEHPMMFGPPGLIQKLSRLSGAVVSADTKPTAAMYGVFGDLSQRLERERSRFNQLIGQLER